MPEEHSQEGLFQDFHVSFIESKELTRSDILELTAVVESHGAHIVETKPNGRVKLSEVTHIVSNTSDFPDYFDAVDHLIPVVNRQFIAQSLTKGKLLGLRPYTPDPKLFFSGITVHCADIPNSDKDAILGAVAALGGQESKVLGKTTTHLVALSTDSDAYKLVKSKHLKTKVVLPHWFDDCLKLGRKIDEKPYILPNPDILRSGPSDPLAVPSTPEMIGATSARPDYLPKPAESPDAHRLHVFDKKKIMLSGDLQLNERLRGVLEGLITKGGGSITTKVEECDIFVCHYRDGDNYVMASRLKKDVGNLSWLFWLITYNRWTSPLLRLLHYPVPRDPIPGFETTKMSLSNYGGEARIYLENLIKACGGEATKAFRMDNTHLITARVHSEKCEAAQEWGLPMVNHLWLEESYAKCKMQSLTNARYTHFPTRTNLGEVVGRTQFDPKILEEYYMVAPDSQTTAGSPVKSRAALEDKTNAAQHAPAEDDAETEGEPEAEDPSVMEVDMPDAPQLPPSKPAAKVGPKGRKTSTTPLPNRNSTPAIRRLREASKENESPSSRSTPSRASKDRANDVLHDLAADIADYEKERKRKVSGGVWGGKRAADALDKERSAKRASSVMTAATSESDEVEEEETKVVKKAKTAKVEAKPKAQKQMKLLITGYKKWANDITTEDRDKKKLKELGVQVITDANGCNFMAAPAMVRTQKFLCALANGVTVLNSEFIDTCITSSTVPDPSDFILVDKANEKRFGVVLADAVARAKAKPRRLLQGVAVFCTEDLPNGYVTYQSIIQSNGGDFAVYRGRKGLNAREDGEVEEVYLLTGTSSREKKLWPKFTEMAKEAGHKPRIVHTEWLLDTAMAQEIKWKQEYLAK